MRTEMWGRRISACPQGTSAIVSGLRRQPRLRDQLRGEIDFQRCGYVRDTTVARAQFPRRLPQRNEVAESSARSMETSANLLPGNRSNATGSIFSHSAFDFL